MGFPCEDICVAGNRQGFDTDKADGSRLFYEGMRWVDESGPHLKIVYLENVQHIVRMTEVWRNVLGHLHRRGFDAAWCVVTGAQCGLPQKRARLRGRGGDGCAVRAVSRITSACIGGR